MRIKVLNTDKHSYQARLLESVQAKQANVEYIKQNTELHACSAAFPE